MRAHERRARKVLKKAITVSSVGGPLRVAVFSGGAVEDLEKVFADAARYRKGLLELRRKVSDVGAVHLLRHVIDVLQGDA